MQDTQWYDNGSHQQPRGAKRRTVPRYNKGATTTISKARGMLRDRGRVFGFRFSRKFVHLQTIHNRNMSNVSAGEALLSLKGDAGSGATLSHDLPARNCWGSDSERLPLRIDPSSTFLPLPREWAT